MLVFLYFGKLSLSWFNKYEAEYITLMLIASSKSWILRIYFADKSRPFCHRFKSWCCWVVTSWMVFLPGKNHLYANQRYFAKLLFLFKNRFILEPPSLIALKIPFSEATVLPESLGVAMTILPIAVHRVSSTRKFALLWRGYGVTYRLPLSYFSQSPR